MTRLELPIRLRFLRIPAKWELRTVRSGNRAPQEFVFPTIKGDGSLEGFAVTEMDIWKCRERFLDLPEGDNTALLKSFLNKTGRFLPEDGELLGHHSEEVMEHYRKGNPQPLSVAGIWDFRRSLREALTDTKAFKATYAPTVHRPTTGLALLRQRGISFSLGIELTDVVSGVITLNDTYHALMASVFIDVARGIHYKTCQRGTCDRLFPMGKQPSKVFCSPECAHAATEKNRRDRKMHEREYCGHLESGRKTRAARRHKT